MDTDGGWGAVLDGVDGATANAAPAGPHGDAWNALDALVDQSSGGDATGNLFARVVALVGAYVPPELRDAAEALLRVADGTSSWSGAVIDTAPRPPVAVDQRVAANAPAAPPVRESQPEPTPEPAPAPAVPVAPADAVRVAPADDAEIPDDPTFDAAIGVSGATASMEVTR
jgi:hypothetical protein